MRDHDSAARGPIRRVRSQAAHGAARYIQLGHVSNETEIQRHRAFGANQAGNRVRQFAAKDDRAPIAMKLNQRAG